jgi:hypothetical protein
LTRYFSEFWKDYEAIKSGNAPADHPGRGADFDEFDR